MSTVGYYYDGSWHDEPMPKSKYLNYDHKTGRWVDREPEKPKKFYRGPWWNSEAQEWQNYDGTPNRVLNESRDRNLARTQAKIAAERHTEVKNTIHHNVQINNLGVWL